MKRREHSVFPRLSSSSVHSGTPIDSGRWGGHLGFQYLSSPFRPQRPRVWPQKSIDSHVFSSKTQLFCLWYYLFWPDYIAKKVWLGSCYIGFYSRLWIPWKTHRTQNPECLYHVYFIGVNIESQLYRASSEATAVEMENGGMNEWERARSKRLCLIDIRKNRASECRPSLHFPYSLDTLTDERARGMERRILHLDSPEVIRCSLFTLIRGSTTQPNWDNLSGDTRDMGTRHLWCYPVLTRGLSCR